MSRNRLISFISRQLSNKWLQNWYLLLLLKDRDVKEHGQRLVGSEWTCVRMCEEKTVTYFFLQNLGRNKPFIQLLHL